VPLLAGIENIQLGILAAAVAVGGLVAVLLLTALLARAHQRKDQPQFVRRIGRLETPPAKPRRTVRLPSPPPATVPYLLGIGAIAVVIIGVVGARVLADDRASPDDAVAAILDLSSPTADLSGFLPPPTPTPDLSLLVPPPGTPTPDLSGFLPPATPTPDEQRCTPGQRAQARC
jgi:hypothetical protein